MIRSPKMRTEIDVIGYLISWAEIGLIGYPIFEAE